MRRTFMRPLAMFLHAGLTRDRIIELGGSIATDNQVTFTGENVPEAMRLIALSPPVDVSSPEHRAAQAAAIQEFMKRIGPPLWEKIHVGALTVEPERFNDVLDEVDKALPCGGACQCREKLRRIRKESPPPLTTKEANFAWSVEQLHNAVNVELGRPTMTVDEARQIHAK